MPASFDTPREVVREPSAWIQRWGHLIPPGGTVLDIACGQGRHTRWALAAGLRVIAVDIETRGVADLAGHPSVEVLAHDLEAGEWPFTGHSFTGIVMTNYLHRPLLPRLAAVLAPGGVLLVDSFALGNEALGRPRNPDFLLAPGELLRACGDLLQVVAYEAGHETQPRPAVRQRLCAVRSTEPARLSPA